MNPLKPYLLNGNPYGYEINIKHPVAAKYYRRFKKYKGIPTWCPLSDRERKEFEYAFIELVHRNSKGKT